MDNIDLGKRGVKFTLCRSAAVVSALVLALLSGCSATTLRCGTDGESSFVDLVNVPQDLSSQTRHFKDLCGFAYEVAEDE